MKGEITWIDNSPFFSGSNFGVEIIVFSDKVPPTHQLVKEALLINRWPLRHLSHLKSSKFKPLQLILERFKLVFTASLIFGYAVVDFGFFQYLSEAAPFPDTVGKDFAGYTRDSISKTLNLSNAFKKIPPILEGLSYLR